MERYTLPTQQNSVPAVPRTVALGMFDGLHSGHRAVIAAALRGVGRCAVYTFDPATVTTKPGNCRLMETEELCARLEKLGVQDVFTADFAAVKDMTPARFVTEILVELLHADSVVCGFNYRFGAGGVGDTDTLTTLCAAQGITVTVVPPTTVEGETVSSTAIRQALADGDMAKARRMLSNAYGLCLPVIEGQHLGRRLGMPTINQVLPPHRMLPRFGVYASAVEIGNRVYHGVTNIGRRPTVGTDTPLAETWIDGFEGDVYGQTVTVYPVKFLRSEQAFPTLEALQAQVRADAAEARALFAPTGRVRAVLFDFDDTLHIRDDAFRRALTGLVNKYYPSDTDDERQRIVEEMFAKNRHGYGMGCSFREFLTPFLPNDTTDIDEFMHYFFIRYADSCILQPDVSATLDILRQQGIQPGVITNGGSLVQNGKVDMAGLRPLLDIVAVGGDETVQKPDPLLFRRVAARLGVACEDCVYVGDHPVNDIAGARSAGMRAVFIEYGRPADHPCHQYPLPPDIPVIHAIGQLPAVLETLNT